MAGNIFTADDLARFEQALKKNPSDAMNYVNLAEAQLALHHESQAFSTFRAAKVLCPDNPDVLRIGSKVLEALDRKEEAIECLQKAIAISSKLFCDTDSISHLAELLYNSGKKEEALAWLGKLAKNSSDNPEVLIRLAQIQLSLGNSEEAQRYLKVYRETSGATREMFLLMGQAMLARKFYDGAVKNYSDGIKSFPEDSDMHLGLGLAWIGMDEKGAALKELTEALSIKPNDINILIHLGKLQNDMGMTESADETFAKVESGKPENGECFLEIAKYFYKHDNQLRGYKYLEAARKLSPFHPEILKLLGQADLDMKKYEPALEVFTSAAAVMPEAVWAHEGVIVAADHIGRYSAKAEAQKKLLTLKKPSAEDWCDYGETLIRLGQFDNSKEVFETAAKLDPTCLRAYQAPEIIKLEKLRLEGEKIAKQGMEAYEKRFYMTATERLTRALNMVPKQLEWSRCLAKISLKTGEIEKASQLLSTIRAADASDYDTNFQLAKTYEFLNNFQMATELLTALTRDYPLDLKAHLTLLRVKRSQIRGYISGTDMLDAIIRNLDSDFASFVRESPIPLIVKGYAYYLFSFRTSNQADGLAKAEACFKKAMNDFADHKEAIRGLALIERVRCNLDKAVEYTKTIVNLSNAGKEKQLELARLYENFRLFGEAAKTYAALREAFPENGYYRRKYVEMTAMLQQESGKNELTVLLSDAHKNIIAKGNSAWAVFETAIGQEMASRMGNLSSEWLKRSMLSWHKAETFIDNNPWILWEMIRCQLRNLNGTDKQRRANVLMKLMSKNLREMPDSAEAWAAMARCHLAFNDLTNLDKALHYLLKAWFIDSSSAEIGTMLAETAKGVGKSVMVDVVGYNVVLSEPELANSIFKLQ